MAPPALASASTAAATAADTDALDLPTLHAFAVTLAQEAGQLLLDALHARRESATHQHQHQHDGDSRAAPNGIETTFSEKLNAVDIVTATDTAVEAHVRARIAAAYPDHAFVGEEMYAEAHPDGTPAKGGAGRAAHKPYLVTDRPTWVVDPLDGTVNFLHAFPMFAVSLALCVGGWPVVGAVCAPMMGQMFSAYRGGGSWMNGSVRLPVLGRAVGPIPKGAPGGCVFGGEWGKDRRWSEGEGNSNLQRKIESFVNMAAEKGARGGLGGMVHGVRSLGSATLDLCYVAMGGIDLWWEGGCWEWDVAAGVILLEEAGGLVTTANPPADWETCEVERPSLGGRLYLAVRPAVDDFETGETARQGQERAVREVWKRVTALDYSRPGT